MAFKYAIVLTGSIATGKSTVAKFFSFFGFIVIDADSIAHTILDQEHHAIAQMFGEKFVKNNKIKRKKLGKLIFKDKTKKEALEDLLHPLIFKEIERLSEIEDKYEKPYLVDIPLFFETKRYPIDASLVVYANKEVQLKRLMQRDGYCKKEALSRIQSQIDIEEKRKQATYVIDNSGDLMQLKDAFEKVKEKIVKDFNDRD